MHRDRSIAGFTKLQAAPRSGCIGVHSLSMFVVRILAFDELVNDVFLPDKLLLTGSRFVQSSVPGEEGTDIGENETNITWFLSVSLVHLFLRSYTSRTSL